jgi:hypothetical protein
MKRSLDFDDEEELSRKRMRIKGPKGMPIRGTKTMTFIVAVKPGRWEPSQGSFTAAGICWSLKIHMEPNRRAVGGSASFTVRTEQEVMAKITWSLHDADTEEKLGGRSFSWQKIEANRNWGEPNMYPLEELEKHKKLRFQVQFQTMTEQVAAEASILRSNRLEALLLNLRFLPTDFTIKNGDCSMDCHRLILSAQSSYFLANSKHDFKDKDLREVDLTDDESCKKLPLSHLVEFFYTQRIVFLEENVWDEEINEEMKALLHFADRYLFENLKFYIVEKFKLDLTLENARVRTAAVRSYPWICEKVRLTLARWILKNNLTETELAELIL